MTVASLAHTLVDHLPETPEEGVLYVSIEFQTTMHRCCCGCGNEVVLPLRPAAWRVTYDGETISMWPSVGNWSFPCRSHYVISRSQVLWSNEWSSEQIEAGRQRTLDERRAAEVVPNRGGLRSWLRRPLAWLRRHAK